MSSKDITFAVTDEIAEAIQELSERDERSVEHTLEMLLGAICQYALTWDVVLQSADDVDWTGNIPLVEAPGGKTVLH